MTDTPNPLRIAIGGDVAGFEYKARIIQDLQTSPRVSTVRDVGPLHADDTTAYPHFAIDAAELVARCSSAARDSASRLRPTR